MQLMCIFSVLILIGCWYSVKLFFETGSKNYFSFSQHEPGRYLYEYLAEVNAAAVSDDCRPVCTILTRHDRLMIED